MPGITEFPFGKSLRLLKGSDYKPVFDHAEFKVSSQQVLFLSRPNCLTHPRLGLVIAKKNVRFAVQRNRIKRIIRESFRLHQAQIPALDIVVLARRSIDSMDNESLHKAIAKLWKQLQHKANQPRH